jgi:hypothetical protein
MTRWVANTCRVDNFAMCDKCRDSVESTCEKNTIQRRFGWHVSCSSEFVCLGRNRVGGPGKQNIKFEGGDMKLPKLGSGFTIFVLFFGVALLEAFQSNNWLKAAFWLAIGLVFLVADNLRSEKAA